jgi:hypothetical protein
MVEVSVIDDFNLHIQGHYFSPDIKIHIAKKHFNVL